MSSLDKYFSKAIEVKFLSPKKLDNGYKQQLSIQFNFLEKKNAEISLMTLRENHPTGSLSMNVYQKPNEIEISFIDNNTIEELYIGKFQYSRDNFEDFKKHCTPNTVFYLFICFSDGIKEVAVFLSNNPATAMYSLAGFNTID